MLTGLISSGLVYCVANVGQKTDRISQFWPNFHILWGFLCPSPFNDAGQIWQDTVDMSNFICIYLICRDEKLQFLANVDIWGLMYLAPLPMRAKFGMLE